MMEPQFTHHDVMLMLDLAAGVSALPPLMAIRAGGVLERLCDALEATSGSLGEYEEAVAESKWLVVWPEHRQVNSQPDLRVEDGAAFDANLNASNLVQPNSHVPIVRAAFVARCLGRTFSVEFCRANRAGRFTPRNISVAKAFLESGCWIPTNSNADSLSRRLKGVLELLALGYSEKQVAHRMAISTNTVHCYVKKIYTHFAVASRAELLVRVLAPPAGRQPAITPRMDALRSLPSRRSRHVLHRTVSAIVQAGSTEHGPASRLDSTLPAMDPAGDFVPAQRPLGR